jgi:hypothetical protein
MPIHHHIFEIRFAWWLRPSWTLFRIIVRVGRLTQSQTERCFDWFFRHGATIKETRL